MINHPAMLTVDELETIVSDKTAWPTLETQGKVICEAQVRKVVKWLEEHGKDVFTDEPGRFEDGHYWGIPLKALQSLREAVALKGQGGKE